MARVSLSLVLVSLLSSGCGRSASSSVTTAEVQASGEKVLYPGLIDAYEQNQLAADSSFLGKTITAVIKVNRVAKDDKGYHTAGYYYANHYEGDPNIVCYWSPKHLDDIKNLKFDQRQGVELTVRGVCRGMKLPATTSRPKPQIVLEDCRLAAN